MKYEQRWLIDKPLGEGGQGKVFLVKEVSSDDKSNLKQLFSVWPSPSGAYYEDEREKRQKNSVDLLSQLVGDRLNPKYGALKTLHQEKSARDPKRSRERAALEIKAMRKWQHPNLLTLKDCDGDELWYVSEFHAGGTLDQQLGRYKGDLVGTLNAIRPLVEGVSLLHRNNVVHRDIKPHNIFLSGDGILVLGDFGLIYMPDPDADRLSATFSNVGTHAWMPGWAMDHRVTELRPSFDVFSLGKVIWSMLSGHASLTLWYYNRPQNNLLTQFPDKPEMQSANELFAKCIVENEDMCIGSACELLDEIDEIIERESKGPNFFNAPKRTCRICFKGEYRELKGSEKRNFALNCGGTYDVVLHACDNCRHIELFYIDTNAPPAEWKRNDK